MKLLSVFSTLTSLLSLTTAQNAVLPADQATWDLLNRVMYVSGNAVCVGQQGIQYPFTCDAFCSSFPDFELITSWDNLQPLEFDVSGFLAVDHKRKEFWHVFRGTNTLKEQITNLQVQQQPMAKWYSPELAQCDNCTAHQGFQIVYHNAYELFGDKMKETWAKYPDYKNVVTGHSLGAAAAYLHGLNLKTSGKDPLVITSGQPLVGNRALAEFNDRLFFGDKPDFTALGPSRQFYRLTHREDIIPRLPFWDPYYHSGGEIFIDYPWSQPPLEDLKVCDGAENPNCVFSTSILEDGTVGIVELAHLIYFINFSLQCAIPLSPAYTGN
uniref:triacylglycerol lipase n=1 Tax=Yarrowia yakushimensis TaxID=1527289 RepID=A0A078BNU0_9ASCO|nr:lipase [Yarrowia yakushimensis]